MTLTVLNVVGARPQFIKAAPVTDHLRERHEEVLVHTGQHYDAEMSDVFFEELGVPEPDYDLGVGSGAHAVQTGEMLVGLQDVLDREDPDAVLVYGDTNSTLAGAVAAAKDDALLAHVEAGLRSYDRGAPEEVNRVLTDAAADLLFAPTETAVANLEREGISAGVHRVGDVMYDMLLRARSRARDRSSVLSDLDLADGEYVLATIHRAVNADDPDRLGGILDALRDCPDPVVFPVHPRTEKRMREFDLRAEVAASEAVHLTDPVGYLDFVRLLDGARRVATDSGGVQKEAYLLETPCVTLREETEWTQTVELGWNALVGVDPDAIRSALRAPITRPAHPDLFGDGEAARRVVEVVSDVA